MFDLSAEKILVILVIALVVLGPGRLAESARGLGRARAQLRKWSAALPPEGAKLIRNPRGALLGVLAEPRQAVGDAAESLRRSVVPPEEPDPGEGTT